MVGWSRASGWLVGWLAGWLVAWLAHLDLSGSLRSRVGSGPEKPQRKHQKNTKTAIKN